MSIIFRIALATAASLAAASQLGAQRAAPPIRSFGPVIARATDTLGAVLQLVELGDGRVVVNDNGRQRLVILDSSLSHPVVIIDTSTTAKRRYPTGQGGTLMRYIGDSLLFAVPQFQGMLIIDPGGAITRVVAFPPGPAPLIRPNAPLGVRSDVNGNIVYWTMTGGPCGDPLTLDSVPLLRSRIGTRVVDTVGFEHSFKQPCPTRAPAGVMGETMSLGPAVPRLVRRDEWGLMRDGTVALVRAQNYTIDWVDPDGTRRSSPRIASDWHRLTDSDKVAAMDSLRRYYATMVDSEYQMILKDPEFVALPPDQKKMITPQSLLPQFRDPADLPDYLHAFQNPVRGDADGNLWIPEGVSQLLPQPPNAPPPQTVFDIVNRQGVLIDRVQAPGGTTIVGFGPGVAYLTSRDGATTSLIRVRIR